VVGLVAILVQLCLGAGREKVRELEEERNHLEDSLSLAREREERTSVLLSSSSQDPGLLHLVDTVRQAQQAEIMLKDKVRQDPRMARP